MILMTQLPAFLSRNNLELQNISKTLKLATNVVTDVDSSKKSDPDCISIVFLKNCEPELSYKLAELFNNCLKESCFLDCWKVSFMVPVFKNVPGRTTAKTNSLLAFFLWLAKSLKNL